MTSDVISEDVLITSTPWGDADDQTQIGDDIWVVSTPGHGGLYVGYESASRIPTTVKQCMMTRFPWFEEDCEMIIVIALLWDLLDEAVVARKWPRLTREEAFESAERIATSIDDFAGCLEPLRAAR